MILLLLFLTGTCHAQELEVYVLYVNHVIFHDLPSTFRCTFQVQKNTEVMVQIMCVSSIHAMVVHTSHQNYEAAARCEY